MKRIIFFWMLAVFVTALFAKPVISFENTEYDFGEIKEEDGIVSYEFIFSNTGDEPLIIDNVKSS